MITMFRLSQDTLAPTEDIIVAFSFVHHSLGDRRGHVDSLSEDEGDDVTQLHQLVTFPDRD